MGRRPKNISWFKGKDGDWADPVKVMERRVSRAMSDGERQRKHRAKGYEIGEIPEIHNPVEREACRLDLLRFGLHYANEYLRHEPSAVMIQELILPIQESILHGGKDVIEFPRSTGKTTWIKIAIKWALAYGHRKFVVVIGATAALSDNIFDEIFYSLAGEGNDDFAADFPALAFPIDALGGNKKLALTQLSSGLNTGMKFKNTRFTLPIAKYADGSVVDPVSAGATVVCCSMGGAIKGLVKRKERPDMVFLDDPQTEKMARSISQVAIAEQFIIGSVLGLGGQTVDLTALMAITPIRPGDLAQRFADRHRHGDWRLKSVPYVQGWTDAMTKLLPAYAAAVNEDTAIGDKTHALARQFYLDHQSEFSGLEIIDPQNFTASEIDAVHHLLNMKVQYGDQFEPEFQMNVATEASGEELTPEQVIQSDNGYPRFALPPGTLQAVAFCDVNVSADAGLRYGVCAFGPNNVAALIDYGRYPAAGARLYPLDADAQTKEAALIDGIKHVVGYLRRLPAYRYDNGERVTLRAIAFDGGYEMQTVDRTLKWIGQNVAMNGTQLFWTRGFGWRNYREDAPGTLEVKDHIHSANSRSRDGSRTFAFLAVHADYWREISQRAFRNRYPAGNSYSLFGKDPAAMGHEQFAAEMTYETLIRTYRDERSMRRAWEWDNAKPGHNHSSDVAYNLLALGHWCGLYSPLARVAPSSEQVQRLATVMAARKPVIAQPRKPVVHRKSIFKKVRFQ